jgi:hypothetical protein
MQPEKVHIRTVHDIERAGFWDELIEDIDVM